MHLRNACGAVLVLAAVWPWLQDPAGAPRAPAGSATAPDRDVATRPLRQPLEGVYQLRARFVGGKKVTQPSTGWLAITSRHLFLCLSAPGSDPDAPLLRAGVRTWAADGEMVRTTVALGWFTDQDGEVHVERPGTDERRRIDVIQGGVRIAQDPRNFLEFERVE
jgi:hypothetical protein